MSLGWRGSWTHGNINSGFTYRSRVPAGDAGLTAPRHLALRFTHSSEQTWRERIRAGEILIDGVPAREAEPLRAGQTLLWQRPPWREAEVPRAFEVLFEDGDLLAVAKPAGLPTVPGGGYLENTLLGSVRRGPYPGATPVHRLGRWTSGIVLFALTARARAALAGAWRGREVIKIYHALASGIPAHDTFAIEVPIGPVAHARLGFVHAAVATGGKPSRSWVRVLERRKDEVREAHHAGDVTGERREGEGRELHHASGVTRERGMDERSRAPQADDVTGERRAGEGNGAHPAGDATREGRMADEGDRAEHAYDVPGERYAGEGAGACCAAEGDMARGGERAGERERELARPRAGEGDGGTSLVEVRIETGRPHQIRIHLAAAGHPLVGDPLYVRGGIPEEGTQALPGDGGYLLHAAYLGFAHPVTGCRVEIVSRPPPELLPRAH